MWVVVILVYSSLSFSKSTTELPFFSPGQYSLIIGMEDNCSNGDFKIDHQNGVTQLNLAGMHIFDVRNYKEVVNDNLSDTTNCESLAEDGFNKLTQMSVLTFKETYSCAKVVKYILERTVKVKPGEVELEASQTGDNEFKYSCKWKLVARQVDSEHQIKKKKDNKRGISAPASKPPSKAP